MLSTSPPPAAGDGGGGGGGGGAVRTAECSWRARPAAATTSRGTTISSSSSSAAAAAAAAAFPLRAAAASSSSSSSRSPSAGTAARIGRKLLPPRARAEPATTAAARAANAPTADAESSGPTSMLSSALMPSSSCGPLPPPRTSHRSPFGLPAAGGDDMGECALSWLPTRGRPPPRDALAVVILSVRNATACAKSSSVSSSSRAERPVRLPPASDRTRDGGVNSAATVTTPAAPAAPAVCGVAPADAGVGAAAGAVFRGVAGAAGAASGTAAGAGAGAGAGAAAATVAAGAAAGARDTLTDTTGRRATTGTPATTPMPVSVPVPVRLPPPPTGPPLAPSAASVLPRRPRRSTVLPSSPSRSSSMMVNSACSSPPRTVTCPAAYPASGGDTVTSVASPAAAAGGSGRATVTAAGVILRAMPSPRVEVVPSPPLPALKSGRVGAPLPAPDDGGGRGRFGRLPPLPLCAIMRGVSVSSANASRSAAVAPAWPTSVLSRNRSGRPPVATASEADDRDVSRLGTSIPITAAPAGAGGGDSVEMCGAAARVRTTAGASAACP